MTGNVSAAIPYSATSTIETTLTWETLLNWDNKILTETTWFSSESVYPKMLAFTLARSVDWSFQPRLVFYDSAVGDNPNRTRTVQAHGAYPPRFTVGIASLIINLVIPRSVTPYGTVITARFTMLRASAKSFGSTSIARALPASASARIASRLQQEHRAGASADHSFDPAQGLAGAHAAYPDATADRGRPVRGQSPERTLVDRHVSGLAGRDGWAALALVIDCHTREFATLRQGHNCRQWTCLGFVPVF